MEVGNKLNNFPDWAQSFLSTFYSTHKMEHEAAINVRNLPKVVWNDSTFYVALDTEESNADILNKYGNVVTVLKNVASIEDVEQQLNKQIVAELVDNKKINKTKSIIKLDDELEKVAKTINQLEKFADDQAGVQNTSFTMQTTDPSINKSVDNVTNTPNNTTSNISTQQMDNAAQEQNTTASLVNKLQNQLKNTNKVIKDNKLQINKLQQKVDMYEQKTAKMKNNIIKLANTVKQLQDQIHAYINPGNIYDLNCQEQEFKHYTQTAKESAQAINAEHKVDITTPQGRVSLKDRILQDIDNIKMPEEILTETLEVSPVEEKVNDNNNQVTVINSTNTDINDINDENEDSNETDEVEIIDTDIPLDNTISINNVNKVSLDNNKQFLDNEDADTFKQRICPACQKSNTLCLDKKTASIQNIKCQHCNTKFGVNLNNEQIFKYNNI